MPTDTRHRFEQEVLPFLGAAHNLARWLLRDAHDAEDAVQDALLRAYRFFGGHRGDNPRAWLLAIVRNTCFTWRAQHPRGESVPLDWIESTAATGATGSTEIATPETALHRQAERELLWRGLSALPLEFREVLVLRELEGLSYKEIGVVANVPLGTVMSRLSRGRSLLKEALTQGPIKESQRG